MSAKPLFAFILCTLLLSFELRATHIVGGELNYRQLGGNLFEVTLVVYRDCIGGQAQFDNPATVGIFDGQGNLVASTDVFITDQHSIPNLINSPCLSPPSNICYEVATYVYTVNLVPRAGGYQLVYQRCCRNYTILNIANVQTSGATYIATIPDSAITLQNSNPVFKNLPPTFICESAPFVFDHSAIDFDGDSIVYALCSPLLGASQASPQPQPPNPPPYPEVVWEFPYSASNLFGGVPLTINPVTGVLTATPNASGQYVYGVCAKEYRNGVYLGETKRDFQANVVPCPMITVASIFSPTIVCGSLTAEFTNNSYNAMTYSWYFGDQTTVHDTSSLKNPSWTYPDTGVYQTTLIAYSGVDSLCNDTAVGVVKVYPVFFAGYHVNNDRCSPEFEFIDMSYGVGGTANFWDWDLGDGTYSSDPNPQHTYAQPGLYDVQLITSTDSSCLDTMVQTISVLQIPEADFTLELDTCIQTLRTTNFSSFAASSFWNFSNGWIGSEDEPVHQYDSPGVYKITMVAVTDSACTDSLSRLVVVPPLPESNFQYSVATCDSVVEFTNYSVNAVTYSWDFGDETESIDFSPVHTYTLAGNIPVRLISTSVHSCNDTVIKEIFFVSKKQADFETAYDSCSGLMHFIGVDQNAVSYLWDFGDGTTSTEKSPAHAYSENGSYSIFLTLNGETSCVDSIRSLNYYDSPLGEVVFVPNSFTPNGDGLNDVFKISVYRPCEIYTLSIFNRWGQLIFESEDAGNAEWDGTYKNRMAEEGIYVYLLKGENEVKKGVAYLTR